MVNLLHSGHIGVIRMTTLQDLPPKSSLHALDWPSNACSGLHVDFATPFMANFFFISVDAYSKWVDITIIPTSSTLVTTSNSHHHHLKCNVRNSEGRRKEKKDVIWFNYVNIIQQKNKQDWQATAFSIVRLCVNLNHKFWPIYNLLEHQ